MQALKNYVFMTLLAITIGSGLALTMAINTLSSQKEQTEKALAALNARMDQIDINVDKAITSREMSGHLIGVRTSLKEILVILNKK